ncbi:MULTISPECIES: AbrB/MazE/SpoVT family DNA-binding domain-containing protein [Halolamina]|uniref:Looped-hinge helix DNA binding domain-containing protein, AbrB family n=1 Tax=Halolamina pelagica TaxID=699431 RepID=A0A1I5SDQ9_9EURY|nr:MULTISPECIES: AbrB/MazE/SpoVT family DNA-binding domain-containing protein [Halolamina]NHX37107.1 AbrB/MazE/SpoVT family DNA-binding domain-containing protein [Halolamina sp. R1-12]SFP68832.1 looped-hinge helix DNA binding domain-containing protein, AbrB family [Halolamina pelagica]
MPKVDSKGRVVLPQELRERLDIGPGEEVDIHEENGRLVVEPERDPEEIIDRMEELVAGISDRKPTPYEELDPQAREHVDTIRRQAEDGDE